MAGPCSHTPSKLFPSSSTSSSLFLASFALLSSSLASSLTPLPWHIPSPTIGLMAWRWRHEFYISLSLVLFLAGSAGHSSAFIIVNGGARARGGLLNEASSFSYYNLNSNHAKFYLSARLAGGGSPPAGNLIDNDGSSSSGEPVVEIMMPTIFVVRSAKGRQRGWLSGIVSFRLFFSTCP